MLNSLRFGSARFQLLERWGARRRIRSTVLSGGMTTTSSSCGLFFELNNSIFAIGICVARSWECLSKLLREDAT